MTVTNKQNDVVAALIDGFTHMVKALEMQAMAVSPEPSFIQPPQLTRQEASANRREALLNGNPFYQGQSCHLGHNGLRYSSGATCVTCKRGQMDARRGGCKSNKVRPTNIVEAEKAVESKARRLVALANGQSTFESLIPCTEGHYIKYSRNGACQECCLIRRRSRAEPIAVQRGNGVRHVPRSVDLSH